jgi:putative DNA primase/helicase
MIAPESAFIEFLSGLGISPASDADIIADGQKRRFRIAGDKARERNGEYCLYGDEHPAGWVKSYSAKHGVEYQTWSAGKGAPDVSEEYFAERAKRQEERKAEEQRKMESSAKNAARLLEAMTPVKRDHPYLKRKGISIDFLPEGIGQIGSDIVVPMRDALGTIWNRQAIAPDGEKRFLPGRKRDCFFEIPGSQRHVFFVEGLATGLSVYQATGCHVVVCFDCGNLRPVCDALLSRFAGRMVIAADNDRKTPGNPGVKYASLISEDLNIPYVFPPFSDDEKGSDWNDYASLHGIEAASAEIDRQLEEWRSTPGQSSEVVWADKDNKNRPLRTIANVRLLLRHLGWNVRYDEVKKNAWYDIPGAYSMDNRDNAWMARVLSECYKAGFPIGKDLLNLYLFEIQDDYKYNPVRDWILSKPWDGVDRFSDLAGSLVLEERKCSRELGNLLLKRWLVSCVAAAFAGDRDLLQFRGVLVLNGPQAIGKTKWLQALVPEGSGWFLSGHTLDTRDKDNVAKCISHWIVELGELDATFKAQDVSRLKSFITPASDPIRRPYAPQPSKYMRRTVFCGSVNPDEYLVDSTGNTRWWSLPVTECNFAHGIDMQQVWAQVRTWHLEGERYWLDRSEQAMLNSLNEAMEKSDPVEDLLNTLFDWDSYDEDVELGFVERKTTTEILQKCHGMDRPTKQQIDVAAATLRRLTGADPVRTGKSRARCFLVPKRTAEEKRGFY